MADDNVIIHVEFPTYDTLPDDQKSLVNFLMDNGSVYFRGEYDTNDNLLHMAGSVGLNYQSSTLNPLILYTPDQPVDETNPFSLTHLSDGGASIPTVHDESEEKLHYEGGIIDCNTVLCECNTSLKIYTIGQNTPSEDGGGGEIPILNAPRSVENTRISRNVRVAEDTGMLSIPAKIWATVNGKINKDRTLLPTFIETKGDNGNGITVMKAAFHRNETSSVGRDYSFQLRTSNFIIKDAATGLEHDMFYKIGIVAPPTYTVDEVKQQILDYGCKASLLCDAAARSVEGGYKLLGSTLIQMSPYLLMSGAPSMNLTASDPSAAYNVFSTENDSYNTNPTAFIGGIVVLNPENQDYPVPGGDELNSVNPSPDSTRSTPTLRNIESGDFYTFIYYKLYENVEGQSSAVEVNEEDIPENFFLLTEETGDYNLFASGPLTDTYLTLNIVDSNINGGHVAISEAREVTNRVYYFSPEGPSATTGTYLNQNTSYPIYNEDGTIASYPSYNSFTSSLAYIYKIAPSEEYVIGERMYVNTNNEYCWYNNDGKFYINPNSSGGNGPYPDAWCIHCTTAVTRTTLYP